MAQLREALTRICALKAGTKTLLTWTSSHREDTVVSCFRRIGATRLPRSSIDRNIF
jgi:hypothetical protein